MIALFLILPFMLLTAGLVIVGHQGVRSAAARRARLEGAARLARRRVSWWLLLTVPLAVLVTLGCLMLGSLLWCGISGCGGGGLGRISDPDPLPVLLPSALAALAWFEAVAVVPWLEPFRLRAGVAAATGAAAALLVFIATVTS